MLNFIYNFFYYSDSEKELETITKQRRLRHLLHAQINTSTLKLKHVDPIVKSGIWELEKQLEKHSAVPIQISNKKRKRF